MRPIFYVQEYSECISHFTKILKGRINIVHNLDPAIRILEQYKTSAVTVPIFYERTDPDKDALILGEFRKRFDNIYIVLITVPLTREEAVYYLKAGVKNTISPDADIKVFRIIRDFIGNTKYKELINSANHEKKEIDVFHIPFGKRFFDIAISSALLIMLAPVFAIIAIIIKAESKGPVIYKSQRVGSNYRVFGFYKFRTMFFNADQRLNEYSALNQYAEQKGDENAAQDDTPCTESQKQQDAILVSDDTTITEHDYIVKKKNSQKKTFVKYASDPRITRVGHFLRKYSLDELPQLLNILKGEMSIVGNRPLPLYEAELLTDDRYIERFIAPAGLTGLWQVEKRGNGGSMSPEERKQCDIFYANNYTALLDLRIIFRTFFAFIQKEDV